MTTTLTTSGPGRRDTHMTNEEIAYLAGVVVVEFVAIAALVILIGAGA